MATLLTRAECEQILKHIICNDAQTKVKLHGFQVEPALNAIGYLGEYFRLTLSYVTISKQQPEIYGSDSVVKQLKLFVKSLPRQNSEPEKIEIFKKESRLYATILKELQLQSAVKWGVNSYLTRDDLIVLQDLQELGYQLCENMSESLNELEMKQILRGLAALHASSIAYEVSNNINIGTYYRNLLREITVAPNVAWYTTGLKAVLAVIKLQPKYQTQDMQAFIETKLEPRLECVYEMINPSSKYRNVLCHRDPWRGNIFLNKFSAVVEEGKEEENTSAIFVDYQTCRYCPASIDIIFAIFMNLNQQQRQLKESYYLKWYYYNFCKDLKLVGVKAQEHMTEADLLRSYREFQLFGHVYKTIAATILEVPKAFVTNEYKHVERTAKVLEYMQDNSSFQHHMEQYVEDIIELIQQNINDDP